MAAASVQNWKIAIALFLVSCIATVAIMSRVFYSILKQNDQTPVHLPAVHQLDGSTVEQTQLTVNEHDKQIANQMSSQLAVFGLAALWLFMWTGANLAFVVFAAYLAYRAFYHPLFRVHLWNESDDPALERPFGSAPLFKETRDASVKVVAGRQQFQEALKSAEKGSLVIVDCSATWCPPCRAMAPVFSKMAQEFKDSLFLTIDIDISQDVAADLSITGVPSFFIYRDEELLERLTGATPKKLRETIENYL